MLIEASRMMLQFGATLQEQQLYGDFNPDM
jgi:hypothetical protein